jgi:hypothetical protein
MISQYLKEIVVERVVSDVKKKGEVVMRKEEEVRSPSRRDGVKKHIF